MENQPLHIHPPRQLPHSYFHFFRIKETLLSALVLKDGCGCKSGCVESSSTDAPLRRILGWSDSREADYAAREVWEVFINVLARFVPWLWSMIGNHCKCSESKLSAVAVLQEEKGPTFLGPSFKPTGQSMFYTQRKDFQQCICFNVGKELWFWFNLVLFLSSQKTCYYGNKTPHTTDVITCCEAPVKKWLPCSSLCFCKAEVWGSVSIVMPFKSTTSSFTLK